MGKVYMYKQVLVHNFYLTDYLSRISQCKMLIIIL